MTSDMVTFIVKSTDTSVPLYVSPLFNSTNCTQAWEGAYIQ